MLPLPGRVANTANIYDSGQPRRDALYAITLSNRCGCLLLLSRKEHPSMEQRTLQSVLPTNQQSDGKSQVLTIEGCRVKINYLPSRIETRKENVLGSIQKSLLAACQAK